MKWLVLVAGLVSMKAAIERHDVDEASRQGTLAGPAVVAQALADRDRPTRLAGIAAAPRVEDRAELLVALAKLAGGADRRVAIPAARAAKQIARELGAHGPLDDLAAADLVRWHEVWLGLATRDDRWIELRVTALDVAAALGEVPLSTDPDPAFRRAAIELSPVPSGHHGELAEVVANDADDRTATAAAQVLCIDNALEALDARGKARVTTLGAVCKR